MNRGSQIAVSYDGEALQTGRMDVRDLAPALLALGELIEEANDVLNGPDSKVTVSVVSRFKRGSFGFEADIVQNVELFERAISLFTEGHKTTEQILQILFWGFSGGLATGEIIRRIKGRKTTISQHSKGQSIVQYGSHSTIVNNPIVQLITSPKSRSAWDRFTYPPRTSGIDHVKITGEKPDQEFTINSSEAEYFASPDFSGKTIHEYRMEIFLSIVSLSFKEENKWRMTDGNNFFYIQIEDKDFWDKVERNEIVFAKGDRIKADLLVSQVEKESGGLRTDYVALKILEHIKGKPPPVQRNLEDQG